MKLFDSERKVMEVLWQKGELPAGQIVKILKDDTKQEIEKMKKMIDELQ